MANPDSNSGRQNPAEELPILLLLLAAVGWVVWHFANKALLAESLRFRGWEMGILGHLPFLPQSGNFRDTAAAIRTYPTRTLEGYSWQNFRDLSFSVGSVLRLPAAVLLALFGFLVARRGVGSYTRGFIRSDVTAKSRPLKIAGQVVASILGPVRAGDLGKRFGWKVSQSFDVRAFVRELSLTFPQVLPVADAPPGPEPALSELEFAIRSGILRGKNGERFDPDHTPSGPVEFDRGAARAAFSAQLGNHFADEPGHRLSDCPSYVWGIAAVCLARLAGPSGKEDSEFLIEYMARSFGTGQSGPGEGKEKETIARMIEKYERNAEALRSMRNHGFVNTAIPALFSAAKKYGQLTTSDFIWLKSVDRTLFYALNQVGRKVAFVEAAGCRAHSDAEEAKGEPLFESRVDRAVEALERRLAKLGYLDTGGKKK